MGALAAPGALLATVGGTAVTVALATVVDVRLCPHNDNKDAGHHLYRRLCCDSDIYFGGSGGNTLDSVAPWLGQVYIHCNGKVTPDALSVS